MPGDASPSMQLTGDQAAIVVAIERAGASLSLFGVILILVTFALFKRMRTVPNTFILFASIANIGASTASLIGLSGIAKGSDSSLCRAQAFLLELFMQSDPWWSFAMAFNVFLVFFCSANPTAFRRYLWVYCLVCFGLPLIPAIVCLYLQSATKGPVYGDATLWCWIDDQWNSLRIFTYYMPIWICIFFSAVIYFAVGYHVFHRRNQLRNLTLSNQAKEAPSEPGFYGTVTTEVQITRGPCDNAPAHERTPPTTPLGPSAFGNPGPCPWIDDPFPHVTTNTAVADLAPFGADTELGLFSSPSTAIHGASSSSGSGSSGAYQITSTTTVTANTPSPSPPGTQDRRGKSEALQTPAKKHAKHPRSRRHTKRTQAATQLRSQTDTATTLTGRVRRAGERFVSRLQHMDPVKLAYLRTSFVFAISVLVTWTPSSINRVYTLVYPERSSYGLNIASAAVLPLQGVWNAVIYFTTSWKLLRDEVDRVCYQWRWLRRLGVGARIDAGSGLAGRGRLPSHVLAHEGQQLRQQRQQQRQQRQRRQRQRQRQLGGAGALRAAATPGLVPSAEATLASPSSSLLSTKTAAATATATATATVTDTTMLSHGPLPFEQAHCHDQKPHDDDDDDNDDDDDDEDDEDDGDDPLVGRRLRPHHLPPLYPSTDMASCPPRQTRRWPATLRVQKGGQLDSHV